MDRANPQTAQTAEAAQATSSSKQAATDKTSPTVPSPPVEGNERPLAGAGPVVTAFVLFGVFWGSWAVMLFDIQHAFHLNDAQLGVLLAVAVAVAGLSSAVTAHLADRVGARRLLWISLLSWAALLCVLAAMEQKWAFAVVLVLTEVAGGSIDTAMNAEASHRLVDHPTALVRLHALFNTGALSGAAVAALVIHAGVSWRWIWPGIAVGALVVGVWAAATDSGTPIAAASPDAAGPHDAAGPPHRAGRTTVHPLRRLRRDGLLVLLAVFALAEVTEGGVDTWGVLFLRNHLATGVLLGASAYVVGQLVAATTRGAGGHLLGRMSTRSALVTGGCVAGGGILLESLSPVAGVAAVGLALGAGGASLFWPLVMSTVSRRASQVVSAVGTFTAAGYVGWVGGAPIVGWVSESLGPARGLQVLALAAFGVAACTLLSTDRPARSGANGYPEGPS
jgi:MFS family permease